MNTSTTTVVPSVSMTSTACLAGTSSPSINSEFHALSNLVFCSGKTFITFYFLELGCYNKLNWSFPREEIKTLIGNHFIFIIIGRVNSNIPAIAGGSECCWCSIINHCNCCFHCTSNYFEQEKSETKRYMNLK